MKTGIKIIIGLVIILLIPVIIGFFQPKDRIVTEKSIIDKMYFYVFADVTNHWEEPKWRSNIDTVMQQEVIDGQDAWMEHYTNGDSILLVTQKTTENDYIRLIITPDGHYLNRVVTIKDFNGKTAIRISEDAYEPNPIKRFLLLFNDPLQERLHLYLIDLKEKYKNEKEDDSGF